VSRIFVHGVGAVSPSGWGAGSLRAALGDSQKVPVKELARPGWKQPLLVRQVPVPTPRPSFMSHPRLRRSSPISQYAVASAMEALGADGTQFGDGKQRLGIVLCVMSGCVNYSRRFYDETLRDPATASPLVFPETVFNAPGSHLGALLGTTATNYTLVGDPGTFVQGLALGAQWLSQGVVDGCLVIGSEEMDWLTADAFRMFSRRLILSEGAGALYLRRESPEGPGVELVAITDAHLFSDRLSRADAVQRTAVQLRSDNNREALLCDGLQDVPYLDRGEAEAWRDWTGPRLSPKKVLGEGLMAAAAWQCVAAVDALNRGIPNEALVNVAGCNQQVIGVRFKAKSDA
jgi:3-oxoacyl-(acyl-carrier-protein) synthase